MRIKLLSTLFLCVFFLTGCTGDKIESYEQVDLDKSAKPELEKIKQEKQATKPQAIDNSKFEALINEYDGAWINTNYGNFKVAFFIPEAPNTVNNFMNLAKLGFYDGIKFHRVMNDFMIQGGDPNSKDDDWSDDGRGGPGYKFPDEINDIKLVRGSMAMANSGANTNGSQFFIVTKEATPWLDGKHTNFGHVIEGFNIVEKIEKVEVNADNHPLNDVVIQSVELVKLTEGEWEELRPQEAEPEPENEDDLDEENTEKEDIDTEDNSLEEGIVDPEL